MGITDIFSKRMKRRHGDVPEVYVYDVLPEHLRTQIIQIWQSVLGKWDEMSHDVRETCRLIVEALCHERGVFRLPYPGRIEFEDNFYKDVFMYFLTEPEVEKALDVVELFFSAIEHLDRDGYLHGPVFAANAIEQLNFRFREHGIGFSYSSGKIIRMDDEFTHEEIVKPCLQVLAGKAYRGAQEEFLKGEEYYRMGDMKMAVMECQKAVESVMKVICKKRGWKHRPKPNAKELISTLLTNGLIPPFWQNHFASLRSMLEGGSALVRNERSAHGQGGEIVEVPRHLAAYALHMAAATILFLAEAEANGAGK